jgi:hypothetical protein
MEKDKYQYQESFSGDSYETRPNSHGLPISFRQKVARLFFGRSVSPASHEFSPDEKEVPVYSLADFTKAQFFVVNSHFSTWYEISKNPSSATTHPLVIEYFQDTLDPVDAEEILTWWGHDLDELRTSLDETGNLLDNGLELDDHFIEKVHSIMLHVDGLIQSLLRELDESRCEGV